MVATSYSCWIGAQPTSVPYQPASPSWHSLEGLIKYQTKANSAAGHPWATWSGVKRIGPSKVHRKKEGERDTDCRSNILFASCCHRQADWELICTHYWEMSKARGWWPHYADCIWCDWRCCAMLISSPLSPRYRKQVEMEIFLRIFTVGHVWYKWKRRADYATSAPSPQEKGFYSTNNQTTSCRRYF